MTLWFNITSFGTFKECPLIVIARVLPIQESLYLFNYISQIMFCRPANWSARPLDSLVDEDEEPLSFFFHDFFFFRVFFFFRIFFNKTWHLLIVRLSFGYHSVIVWLSFGYHPVIVWLSYGYCAVIVRLSSGYHLVIIRLSSSYHPVIIRSSSGYHLVMIRLSSSYFKVPLMTISDHCIKTLVSRRYSENS